MPTINQKLGQKIKRCRAKLNITQEELAELADLHRTYIGQIERAEKNITIYNLDKIAKALNLEAKDLLDFSDLPKNN